MPPTKLTSLADVLSRLGGIPAERVRCFPLPGTGVEQDVVEIDAHEDRLCELVDGVLVEKPLGFAESVLAGCIASALNNFVIPRKLGLVTGEGRHRGESFFLRQERQEAKSAKRRRDQAVVMDRSLTR